MRLLLGLCIWCRYFRLLILRRENTFCTLVLLVEMRSLLFWFGLFLGMLFVLGFGMLL